MKNSCAVCRQVMDNEWLELQNHVRKVADLSLPLSQAFVERCIYCYKTSLELALTLEHKWYQEVLRKVEAAAILKRLMAHPTL